MPRNPDFLQSCLALASQEPAKALVLLWLHLQDHANLETGLDRASAEAGTARIFRALHSGGPWPAAHPASMLRAIDTYLEEEGGYEITPHPMTVSVPREGVEATFRVLRRPPGWTSAMAARQAGQIEYWMRYHQIVPDRHSGIEIVLRTPAGRLAKRLVLPELRAAAGGFLDGVFPDWNDHSPYHCRQLSAPRDRWRSVQQALEKAAEFGASILVLPELTIDCEVRSLLGRWLQDNHSRHSFELVVAGTFHEEHSDDSGQTIRRNVCYVLDRWGNQLTTAVKLRPMRAMSEDGELKDEAIEGVARTELLIAPLGLVGLAICLDYCETGASALANLWQKIGPALMLVPSMGGDETDRAHLRRAGDLQRQHATATIIASQRPLTVEAIGYILHAGDEEGDMRASPFCFGAVRWPRSMDS
jgi:predicted amidohydrolase